MMPEENIRKPSVISLDDMGHGRYDWKELDEQRFTINYQKGLVSVQLQPNEALQIEREDIFWIDKEPEEHFDIKKLVLTGSAGTVTYEGPGTYKNFTREDNGWWIGPSVPIFTLYYPGALD
jgi:hypothetical protein